MANVFKADQVVVLGGGLSGVSAANTVIEFGGNAVLLDKSAFCGGNSTKATSGINGANTSTQREQKIGDTAEIFFGDIMKGGAKKPDIAKVLADKSGVGVQWLIDEFKLDLTLLARLGGHSMPRTHRGKERFPGMTITYALIQMLENIEKNAKGRAKIVCKARAHTLIQENGAVIGVKYQKAGVDHQEMGPVIVCTGGFGADFNSDSLLAKHRPDLMHLPTTNGEHCTGDGLKMCIAAGGNTLDLEWVQVHPTGLVKLDEPDAKVKFLAAEALRGVGGLVFDRDGRRFANELGRRDYVTGEMWKGKAPFRLALNEAAAKEIHWHCMHYTGRGVMKQYKTGTALAEDMGIDIKVLEEEHQQHYEASQKQEKDPEGGPYPAYPSGKTWDIPSGKTGVGKKFFQNVIPGSAVATQEFFVAIITPVIHYCMGGVEIDENSACMKSDGCPVPGLYVAGEASGGVHGNNRLGGNALLECVVFGRQAGEACAKYIGLGEKRKETLHKVAGCYPGEEQAVVAKPKAKAAAAPKGGATTVARNTTATGKNPCEKKRVLVIGGGFSGLLVARDLHSQFQVVVVDAKEYFEYTPGILRAYVKPDHFDALTFTLQDVLERRLGVKFLWGEVKKLEETKALIKPMFSDMAEELSFDYCVIAAGCNFGPFHKWGESLWFPTVHEEARPNGSWPHIDERFIEGRRRHILEEYDRLAHLNIDKASVLVVGAGFIGVEWVTELQHFFPNLKLTIIDFLPNCLGPLPPSAANYCDKYMRAKGINVKYQVKYAPKEEGFFESIGMSGPPDKTYVCIGVKASNYFMPEQCTTERGPGGGGWISVNKCLQVIDRDENVWGGGKIFAVGDCNLFSMALMNPLPKISYPSEEQALHAVKSIQNAEKTTSCFGLFSRKPADPVVTWWPWGAGMFATSLGPDDACFVLAANHNKGSGYMVVWGWPCAIQKELIESTKVDECKEGFIGAWIWHYVHHTPFHWIGEGKKVASCPMICGYTTQQTV